MDIRVKSKVWIEVEGLPVFGQGRRMLLEAIDKHGSINQAAKEIDISYRKAWGYIKVMEERLGIRLVHCRTGGRHGGGAILTDETREFLKKYAVLERKTREAVDRTFHDIFAPVK